MCAQCTGHCCTTRYENEVFTWLDEVILTQPFSIFPHKNVQNLFWAIILLCKLKWNTMDFHFLCLPKTIRNHLLFLFIFLISSYKISLLCKDIFLSDPCLILWMLILSCCWHNPSPPLFTMPAYKVVSSEAILIDTNLTKILIQLIYIHLHFR